METFVVRVWVPADDERSPLLRGFVEHARGDRRPFDGGAALLVFLESCLEPPALRSAVTALRNEKGTELQ